MWVAPLLTLLGMSGQAQSQEEAQQQQMLQQQMYQNQQIVGGGIPKANYGLIIGVVVILGVILYFGLRNN